MWTGNEPSLAVRADYTCGTLASWSTVASVPLGSPDMYLTSGYTYAGSHCVERTRTRVAIDPNIRVRGNATYVGFEDVSGPIAVDEVVDVYEPESGVSGEGRITEINSDKELVYLSVDWASLSADESSSSGSDASPGRVFFVADDPVPANVGLDWLNLVSRPCLAGIGRTDWTLQITAPAVIGLSPLVGALGWNLIPWEWAPQMEMRPLTVSTGSSLGVAA
jgi:hypothetical protein